jgi:hypothetical protein
MNAKKFDRKFDSGEEVLDQLDLSKAQRVAIDAKRVNVNSPRGWWRRLTEKRVSSV